MEEERHNTNLTPSELEGKIFWQNLLLVSVAI